MRTGDQEEASARAGTGSELVMTDPALLRGLTESRHTRRSFLRGAGLAGGALAMGSLLSACGIKGTEATGAVSAFDWTAWWSRQKQHGVLNFANWPLYIDTDHGKHPSLDMFTKETGIKVNYFEVIQDNAPFYAQISPTLRSGQPIGYDIIVMTNNDWTTTELVRINKWATPLEHGLIPNFFINATPLARNQGADPGNEYTVPWQSGFTGIAYDPTKIKREITSYHDLWDPAFKGHVGMMSDNTELGSAGLLAIGVDPEKSTQADWKKAAALLQKQRNDGIVRQYYDQSYIKALESGDIWITQAWSGDIFQANNSGYPHLKFVVPKEGIMVWTDVMIIPLHAQNPVDAMKWMDFYYQPKIGAMVADWVNYVTPVGNTQEILQKSDPSVGNSPLVFPTKEMVAQTHQYYSYKNYADFNAWNNTFNPIIQS
jgi:spermidine/putrescine transport system substrate-binding protein